MSLTSMNSSGKLDTFVTAQQIGNPAQPLPGSAQVPGASVLVAPIPRLVIRSHWFERSLALNHRSEWVIGRGKDNDIVLPERWISRHHAVLKYVDSAAFSLVDLGSLNGSYVSNQSATQPLILQGGDRITLGDSEIDFQCPSGEFRLNNQNGGGKTVLMTSSSQLQGEIWREILSSQGLSVLWAVSGASVPDLIKHAELIGQLPSLLLIDLVATKDNPYDLCRWCSEKHPKMRVILTTGMRTELFPSEQQWALRQGALDLFPGFGTTSLLSNMGDIAGRLRVILQALNWQTIEQSPLASTLLALQERLKNTVRSGFNYSALS
jgi:pSer/pThr/pTyr-binding forkhead associated (FHA) protein